jgi:hypothetical protein
MIYKNISTKTIVLYDKSLNKKAIAIGEEVDGDRYPDVTDHKGFLNIGAEPTPKKIYRDERSELVQALNFQKTKIGQLEQDISNIKNEITAIRADMLKFETPVEETKGEDSIFTERQPVKKKQKDAI